MYSRTRRSRRRAQTNSVARIARPAGITTNAGPGRTIIATPIATTVPPTTSTIERHAARTRRRASEAPFAGATPVGGISAMGRSRAFARDARRARAPPADARDQREHAGAQRDLEAARDALADQRAD